MPIKSHDKKKKKRLYMARTTSVHVAMKGSVNTISILTLYSLRLLRNGSLRQRHPI